MAETIEVHPAIGIARVGSSRLDGAEGFFLGPEPGGMPPLAYRDSAGDLKRQAARFRIFRCRRDDRGRLLDAAELGSNSVRGISWTVHLANRKGVGRRIYRSGPGRRNWATGNDEADRELIIDPGPRTVSAPGEVRTFDTGRFRSTPVPLGEISMDPDGRLIVLGGYGVSGSDPPRPRLTADSGHYAENSDWFDDVSDGPVTARVELPDGSVAISRAWVMVGPPDFAPGIANQVTLFDVIFDLAVRRGLLPAPTDPPGRPSFTRHIRPILERGMAYRWVNRAANSGFDGQSRGHGPGGAGDFTAAWAMLADPSPRSEALRTSIVRRLRDPDPMVPDPHMHALALIPRLSDVVSRRNDGGNVLRLTPTQYKVMQAWARGDFEPDLGAVASAELPPDALDRMALEACVGAALYPGVEASGVVLEDPACYADGEPFRLSHDAVRPGEVTGHNALPWQADFLYCNWEEMDGPFYKRLGWWPAQRPDDVFPSADAAEMVPWARGLGEDFQDMIDKWDRLGVVVDEGSPGAPLFVEAERDRRVLGD